MAEIVKPSTVWRSIVICFLPLSVGFYMGYIDRNSAVNSDPFLFDFILCRAEFRVMCELSIKSVAVGVLNSSRICIADFTTRATVVEFRALVFFCVACDVSAETDLADFLLFLCWHFVPFLS